MKKKNEYTMPAEDEHGNPLRAFTRTEIHDILKAHRECEYQQGLATVKEVKPSFDNMIQVIMMNRYNQLLICDVATTELQKLIDMLEPQRWNKKFSPFANALRLIGVECRRLTTECHVECQGRRNGIAVWNELSSMYDDAVCDELEVYRLAIKNEYDAKKISDSNIRSYIEAMKLLLEIVSSMDVIIEAQCKVAVKMANPTIDRNPAAWRECVCKVYAPNLNDAELIYQLGQLEQAIGMSPRSQDPNPSRIAGKITKTLCDSSLCYKCLNEVARKHQGEAMPDWFPEMVKTNKK